MYHFTVQRRFWDLSQRPFLAFLCGVETSKRRKSPRIDDWPSTLSSISGHDKPVEPPPLAWLSVGQDFPKLPVWIFAPHYHVVQRQHAPINGFRRRCYVDCIQPSGQLLPFLEQLRNIRSLSLWCLSQCRNVYPMLSR